MGFHIMLSVIIVSGVVLGLGIIFARAKVNVSKTISQNTFEEFISEIRKENTEIKAELEKMNSKVTSMEKMMKEI